MNDDAPKMLVGLLRPGLFPQLGLDVFPARWALGLKQDYISLQAYRGAAWCPQEEVIDIVLGHSAKKCFQCGGFSFFYNIHIVSLCSDTSLMNDFERSNPEQFPFALFPPPPHPHTFGAGRALISDTWFSTWEGLRGRVGKSLVFRLKFNRSVELHWNELLR